MRPEFNTEQWEKFWRGWEHVIKKLPDAKRMALNEMGKAVLKEVWSQIGQQGINDRYGRVRRWQSMRIGSRGGYVAVSPDTDVVQVTKAGKKTTSKDVTRYLERGHRVRQPSGRTKRYVARFNDDARTVWSENFRRGDFLVVKGRQFYSYARTNAERIAVRAAEKQVLVPLEEMLDELYGDALYEGTRYEEGG